jgi:putative DNA primase/helicase
VLRKLVEAGKNDEEIKAIFIDPANRVGEHCRERPEGADKYLDRNIKRARNKISPKLDIPEADKGEIVRLAELNRGEYEKQRAAAAKKLGYRKTTLDELVGELRQQYSESKGQGHTIEFPEPDPWHHKVDGAELLDAITAKILEHVVLLEHLARAIAVWILFTYLVDTFQFAPRLGITSPTKGCGKSTLLGIVSALSWRALQAANISSSAVYRVIDKYQPTLLIDEADTFLIDNNELRGVLNSGHLKGANIIRASGDDFEPRAFKTYAACAIAQIGSLPPTVVDRSIHIPIQRRKRSDKEVKPFRLDRLEPFKKLARQCQRWADDHRIEVGAQDPELPSEIYNRAADNWRVLKAIALVAGGPWAGYVDECARIACMEDVGEDELLVMLLKDIRETKFVYEVRHDVTSEVEYSGEGEIKSQDLVQHLVQLEGRPWLELPGKDGGGKPLTQNKLARLLSAVHVAPEEIGPKYARARGYRLAHFSESFERYLRNSPEGGPQLSTRPQARQMATSSISQPSTPKNEWTVGNCEKPNNDGLVDGWTVAEGRSEEKKKKPAPELPELPEFLRRSEESAKPAINDNKSNGDGQGLGPHTIQELARRYRDRFEAERKAPNGDDDPEAQGRCDAELRRILVAEYHVFPERVGAEFERVMRVVFDV